MFKSQRFPDFVAERLDGLHPKAMVEVTPWEDGVTFTYLDEERSPVGDFLVAIATQRNSFEFQVTGTVYPPLRTIELKASCLSWDQAAAKVVQLAVPALAHMRTLLGEVQVPSEIPPLLANIGHGHVFPREDGVRMRCGGPGLCKECSADKAFKDSGIGRK